MDSESVSRQETSRGLEIETLLWGVVARLRAHGWRISLREIGRAQDVTALLVARLGRPPTDDELLRHLRPIFCGEDSELAVFDDAFRQSAATGARPIPAAAPGRRRRWSWSVPFAGVLLVVFAVGAVITYLANRATESVPGPSGQDRQPLERDFLSAAWPWMALAVVTVACVAVAVWFAHHKRLRRRSGPPTSGYDLDLRWDVHNPLDPAECARTARALRARSPEQGRTLDLPRTIDASIRAGRRFAPRFVQYQRSPEYLAVIEQRSPHDVLAAHRARTVDQIGACGVAIRRVGFHPGSGLVIDPQRGTRQLEMLQPIDHRERILLFAADRALRDPFTGAGRPWLSRFSSWAETTQIAPDADPDHAVYRVLPDIRALDPVWQSSAVTTSWRTPPAIFEAGDEMWIEPIAPADDEVATAITLLVTELGPNGWYWLSACALYPEINYELTVSLGALLRGDDGEPVNTHLDIEVLAQLPWFRHAYMPDWLRKTLLSSLTHGQLADARTALNEILISGLAVEAPGTGGVSVAAAPRGAGRGIVGSTGTPEGAADRVYLDGSSLRRRRLAVAAPPQLLAALRNRPRDALAKMRSGDAPSLRVRRALAWSNALLLVGALVSSVGAAILLWQHGGDWEKIGKELNSPEWEAGLLVIPVLTAFPLATVALVFSPMAGRRRGVITGSGELMFSLTTFLGMTLFYLNSEDVVVPVIVGIRFAALVTTIVAVRSTLRDAVVPWETFHLRCRRAFALSTGFVLVLTTSWAVVRWAFFPLEFGGDEIGVPTLVGLGFAGTVLVTAAYLCGVRYIPLLAGGTVALLGVVFTIADDTFLTLVFAPPGLLVLGAFYWQVRRAAQHPPLELWETRWQKWKWPLAIAALAAAGAISFALSGGDTLSVAIAPIPVGLTLLNLITGLVTDHVPTTALHRFPTPFHFD
ncbi:hypothetical protein [Saccharopolyspora dendranthemae]|uniref:Uncharacterized protein n=1 Tax=Saccharopolyspora dendranthemae TaxID=1181886 RepID=A0A561U3A6_9PSEU|nr:hypothetical protein [Saccharopolyspora dendranthemae]TWF93842.1 hypothetical protein FHU35_14115 [Saccharopolyspora dendranthemae]